MLDSIFDSVTAIWLAASTRDCELTTIKPTTIAYNVPTIASMIPPTSWQDSSDCREIFLRTRNIPMTDTSVLPPTINKQSSKESMLPSVSKASIRKGAFKLSRAALL